METFSLYFIIILLLNLPLTQAHQLTLGSSSSSSSNNNISSAENQIHVGVIVNMGSWTGKSINSCVSMALSDFYAVNSHYKSRIVPHLKDSNGDPMQTISAGLDLLEKNRVQAIIGPETSSETKFLAELADNAILPMFTFSSFPSSSRKYPFLVQIQQDLLSQVKAITDVVESYHWKSVNLIYEDSDDGREIVPYLTSHFQEVNIRIAQFAGIALYFSDDQIYEELQKLNETTINLVHISPSLSHLFRIAKNLGMTSEGYAWILTDKIMNLWHTLDPYVVDSLEGAIGFMANIPETSMLNDINLRLRKEFHSKTPTIEPRELDVPGIWVYDTVWALATSLEKIRDELLNPQNHSAKSCYQFQEFACVEVSQTGKRILDEVSRTSFNGLSGEFGILNGKVKSKSYAIVNVVKQVRKLGFWTPEDGIVKEMRTYSRKGLKDVIWPGGSAIVPKGKRRERLRIGIPITQAYPELLLADSDPATNKTTLSGYCIEVFLAAIQLLPYDVTFEFIPYWGITCDDLIYDVYLKKLDGAIGDITITAARSAYVDFTFPYTDLGVGTIAKREGNGMWVFLKPLSTQLWLTSGTFFVVMAFVVWIIEHPTNGEFQGSLTKQIGTILWFGFSTLVYAHRERLTSNLSKLVVIVWLFVVFILTSSYTATLSSMMTLKQIQLAAAGDRIGSRHFIFKADEGGNPNDLQVINFLLYNSTEELADALSRGPKKGGVKAIIDEMPYVKLFLGKYGTDYAMVASAATTNGFGFAFSKGSPLVSDLSRAIMKLREGRKIEQLEKKIFRRESPFLPYEDTNMPKILNVQNFIGLFFLSCISFALALLPHLTFKLFKRLDFWNIIVTIFGGGKLASLVRFFGARDEKGIQLGNIR